ncbi:dipeptidase, partial [Candidatus Bathyarchaeota archaeon]|nr:dipeptidase [Candidatus Bathyarchaeota archaeon]
NLVGIDQVGIGMDYGELSRADMIQGMWERYPSLTGQLYDPSLQPPSEEEVRSLVRRAEGLRVPEDWVNVAKGMIARGYSDKEIQKVLGLNLLRVFEKVFGK